MCEGGTLRLRKDTTCVGRTDTTCVGRTYTKWGRSNFVIVKSGPNVIDLKDYKGKLTCVNEHSKLNLQMVWCPYLQQFASSFDVYNEITTNSLACPLWVCGYVGVQTSAPCVPPCGRTRVYMLGNCI